MQSHISSNEKDYISASLASKKVGYTNDYVGQLCRANKIQGQLIGRTWYVDLDSLLAYRNTQQSSKVDKSLPRLNSIRKSLALPTTVHHLTKSKRTIFSERSFNNYLLSYEDDEGSPLPSLSKYSKNIPSPSSSIPFFKKTILTSLLLITTLTTSLYVLKTNAPLLSQSLESSQPALSLLGGLDNLLEGIVSGFRNLKDLALDTLFIRTPPLGALEPLRATTPIPEIPTEESTPIPEPPAPTTESPVASTPAPEVTPEPIAPAPPPES